MRQRDGDVQWTACCTATEQEEPRRRGQRGGGRARGAGCNTLGTGNKMLWTAVIVLLTTNLNTPYDKLWRVGPASTLCAFNAVQGLCNASKGSKRLTSTTTVNLENRFVLRCAVPRVLSEPEHHRVTHDLFAPPFVTASTIQFLCAPQQFAPQMC